MYALCLILLTAISALPKQLPFSSIKMKADEIHVSLDESRSKWHKLLSVNSVGSDAIVNFSKTHYGASKCDYETECYRYNIIVNFDEVYKKLNNEDLPKWVPMELEESSEIEYQNGMDVESTELKYEINQKNIADNIRLTKGGNKIFSGPENTLFKNLANSINSIFNPENGSGDSFLNSNLPESTEIKKQISNMKKEIEAIEKQELEIEKVYIESNN
jgi:hypothetical protein